MSLGCGRGNRTPALGSITPPGQPDLPTLAELAFERVQDLMRPQEKAAPSSRGRIQLATMPF